MSNQETPEITAEVAAADQAADTPKGKSLQGMIETRQSIKGEIKQY